MNSLPRPTLTFQLGGLDHAGLPDWVQMLEMQAKATAEEEHKYRRYTMSPKQTSGLGYDDRLTTRLGCCKTKAYALLDAGLLRCVRIGNKYIVTELAVREYTSDVERQVLKVA